MKKLVVFGMLFYGVCFLYGQSGRISQPASFQFIDQNIRDILYSFSTNARISIIADDTVTGNASFQFSGSGFDQAFESFLLTNRLFVEKRPDVWLVSRISITVDEDGMVSLDTLDATPAQLLEKISQRTETTIIQDILPTTKISLHLGEVTVTNAVELIMRPFTDYTVSAEANYIQVRKIPAPPFSSSPSLGAGYITIQESGGLYTVFIEQARLGEVLDRLFLTAREEYSSFVRGDQIIDRIRFSDKEFSNALTLVLEQANGEYVRINSTWYIFPLQQSEIVRKIRDIGKAWQYYETRYQSFNDLLPLLQSRFPSTQMIAVSGGLRFQVLLDETEAEDFQNYLKVIDIPRHSTAIKLRYIKTEDLFKALPPSVRREELIDAGNGNTLFFVGSPERLALFQEDLTLIDRPQTRIRYDLFIIQYQETSGLDWLASLESRPMRPGDMTMITGQFSNLLNFNFDIITVFGHQFAARINAAISENHANIFADTTLFGLSGQTIKFQNTNTYRYRDSNIDPETAKPIYSGVTREIVSGLMLDINGWVSGDGMITTTVTASISKRGTDVSSNLGNPPPTSEKILTTQVRSRSGEAVVLSGLRQNEDTVNMVRTPLLSKIPFLGWIFKSRESNIENTQMVIYLVPHIDLASDEYTVEGLRTASLYTRFVVPFLDND
jgi:type II secretory pathway component GspD/PulD (secretin)